MMPRFRRLPQSREREREIAKPTEIGEKVANLTVPSRFRCVEHDDVHDESNAKHEIAETKHTIA